MKALAAPILATIFLALPVSEANAARCGFFDLLFGCAEPRPVAIQQSITPHARRHVLRPNAAPTPRDADTRASGGTGKQAPLVARPGEMPGSLAIFRRDATLRTGDIVTTTDGFFEYRGGAFVPVNARKTASLGLRLARGGRDRSTQTVEQGAGKERTARNEAR